MRLSRGLLAVGFGMNAANYLAWSVLPARAAFTLGASPLELGALPVLGGVTYLLTALRVGRLSDRVPRETLARWGIAGWALFCVLAWRADSLPLLYAATLLDGVAQAFIWPCLQARVGDVSEGRDLERNLGTFSISWSAGKTAGFFVFMLLRQPDPRILLLCAALCTLLVVTFPRPRHGHGTLPPEGEDNGPPAAERASFRRSGWLANFAGFGMGATLVYLYPDMLKGAGRPAWHHGAVLGTLFLSQTAGFFLFGRWTAWRWRRGPLAAAAAVGAGALLVIGLGAPLPLALGAALVLGLAVGLAYAASIYYSVHAPEDRGARAGIHEAVVGAANFGVPLAAGAVADLAGSGGAAYATSAGVALAVGALHLLPRGGAPTAATP